MDEAPGWTAIDDALSRIYGDATPHGRIVFLQAVGLTADEHEAAASAGNAAGILDLVATRLPLLITDIDRRSLLITP